MDWSKREFFSASVAHFVPYRKATFNWFAVQEEPIAAGLFTFIAPLSSVVDIRIRYIVQREYLRLAVLNFFLIKINSVADFCDYA